MGLVQWDQSPTKKCSNPLGSIPRSPAGLDEYTCSDYLQLSQTISDYLGLSQTILDYLGLSRTIRNYLGLSQTFSDYLRLSRAISGYLELSWPISDYLGLSWAIWSYLHQVEAGEGKLLQFETFLFYYYFSLERFLEELALLKMMFPTQN